jgi:hypothetical protein
MPRGMRVDFLRPDRSERGRAIQSFLQGGIIRFREGWRNRPEPADGGRSSRQISRSMLA